MSVRPSVLIVVYSSLSEIWFACAALIEKERMAFLLNKASMLSQRLQSSSSSTDQAQAQAQRRVENSLFQSQRSYHVQLGDREKALLKDDPSLRRFKSHKKALYRLKRFGDALTIIVVAGCCYEIYVKATMREEARKQAHEQS